jgi:hypothetical protein
VTPWAHRKCYQMIKKIYTREDVHEWLVKPEGYLASSFRNKETYIELECVVVSFLKQHKLMNEDE